MSSSDKMTMEYLLCYLRQRLVDATAQDNRQLLETLAGTFDMLTNAAYESPDRPISGVLEELQAAAGEILMGAEAKANIPSIEAIKLATSGS